MTLRRSSLTKKQKQEILMKRGINPVSLRRPDLKDPITHKAESIKKYLPVERLIIRRGIHQKYLEEVGLKKKIKN